MSATGEHEVLGDALNRLCDRLCRRTGSATVRNPYETPGVIGNLRAYFEFLLHQRLPVLLVGEAPGHRGCGITGVPFTSGQIVQTSPHPVWRTLRNRIVLPELSGEVSARCVWGMLEDLDALPVMWNAFPFHPHQSGATGSNRTPNAAEQAEGRSYLEAVIDLFAPEILVGIGRKGEAALSGLAPRTPVAYVRHPARGGQAEFKIGLREVLRPYTGRVAG